MPKNKKSKVVSLVAYESGAESENGSENESETSDAEQEEIEKKGDVSSEAEVDNVEESSAEKRSAKRTRETSDFSDDNEEEEDDEENSRQSKPDSQYSDEFKQKKKTKKMLENTEKDLGADLLDQNSNESAASRQSVSVIISGEEVVKSPNPAMQPQIEVDAQSKITDSNLNTKFTLDRGFPIGCENIRIPAPPRATCSQNLQNKIIQVVERMGKFNYNINQDIHRKKSFKNPSIYEKLIEAYGIEEFGSSFPTHIEDLKASGYLFYDELDHAQRLEWAKIENSKKERTKIEMVSATKKTAK